MPGLTVDWTWTPVSIVAAYAAIVSSALLVMNVITYRRDRLNIRLKVQYSFIPLGPGQKMLGPFYAFDVANVGRRTVTLSNYGFLAKDKAGQSLFVEFNPYNPLQPALSSRELPFELAEGKSKLLRAIPETAREGLRVRLGSPPKKAYVQDVVGRKWTSKVPTQMRDELWGDGGYRPWWKFWEQGWWPL